MTYSIIMPFSLRNTGTINDDGKVEIDFNIDTASDGSSDDSVYNVLKEWSDIVNGNSERIKREEIIDDLLKPDEDEDIQTD